MRALTIRQPWAWAILHAGKRLENRSWRPPNAVAGQTIAIHAGRAIDAQAVLPLGVTAPGSEQFALGAVVGTARVVTYSDGAEAPWIDQVLWWRGPVAWLLADVRVLPVPVPCRGAQGLWTLPADVEAAVLAQLPAPIGGES